MTNSMNHPIINNLPIGCACFPRNPNEIPVSVKVNPTNNPHIERLVVYLFRNKITHQIVAYVPNAEKQVAFPDITLSSEEPLENLPIGSIDLLLNNPRVLHILQIISNYGVPNHPNNVSPETVRPEHGDDFPKIISKLTDAQLEVVFSRLSTLEKYRQIFNKLIGVTIREKLMNLRRMYPLIFKWVIAKIQILFPNGVIEPVTPGEQDDDQNIVTSLTDDQLEILLRLFRSMDNFKLILNKIVGTTIREKFMNLRLRHPITFKLIIGNIPILFPHIVIKPVTPGLPNEVYIISSLTDVQLKLLLQHFSTLPEYRLIISKLVGITIREKFVHLRVTHPLLFKLIISKIPILFPRGNQSPGIFIHFDNRLQFPYDINLLSFLNEKNPSPQIISNIIIFKPTVVQEKIPGLDSRVTFDNWIKLVLLNLANQMVYTSSSFKISLTALHNYITEILHKNNLSINANGHLVDSSGNILYLIDLRLHPVLIGFSSVINNIVNNGLSNVPTENIFIELVLHSGGEAKILGIIPVTNIFLSVHQDQVETTLIENVEVQVTCVGTNCEKVVTCRNPDGTVKTCSKTALASLNKYGPRGNIVSSQQAQSDHHNCRGGHCQHHKLCNSPYGCIQSKNNTSSEGAVIEKRSNLQTDSPKTSTFDGGYSTGADDILVQGVPVYPANYGGHGDKIYYRSYIPNPHNHLGHYNSGNSYKYILDRSGKPDDVTLDDSSIEHSGKESEHGDPDETPGIRIVGGAAATSSGAPISSKGRSGY
ncbi:uncharacterized protein LOC126978098 [Leptidea sinapis]|uniref:uncharacterized protein LOC126978098 n=1 Tax=Leptidea sinapis TaxID=189913 RepID=UPI0021C2C9BA|nr:uncharacterized protein LOC126978098 [Leptidea sinapis]